ncbi:MAG TPA: serine/threonine-protein kinase [Rhodothermales bacterium]|nr:serine/threonine-protein kinase [Rhodothermales bacterium]
MTPERWQQIDALFHEALSQPPEVRSAFLAEACGSDADLREEVEALLQSDDESLSVLHASREDLAGLLASERPAQGEQVGPYRLIEERGRGGMGAVYLAERADGQFEKKVALKLVKRGMDTDEILRRFRHERQILATLEHPHIARLYDGGVTDSGRPYLVMEFVDGQSINHYCDEKRLSVDARLGLFQTVCEAVQYAHQNLIVHRDLKPSNILVTSNGEVKLLDFGIAKLLDAEALDLSVPLTRPDMRVLTPEYAAPEQVRGEAITTATDVYALGVVLYELLTGSRPYQSTGRSASEIEQAVLEAEPERPSTAVTKEHARAGTTEPPTAQTLSALRATSVAHLQKRLRGDLDTILLKALQKEPARRYASAEAFLEDIKRHLAGLPIQAQPDTVRYRAQKFVQRHRFGVAAAAIFLLLLTGFATAMAFQQAATARERDRAAQERDKAEEVAAFLQDLFDASDPFLATTERLDTLRVRDFLGRGAAKIQREMQGQPALQAEMLDVIGNVYLNLGLYDTALPLVTQGLEQRRTLYGHSHPDIAESLKSLAKTFEAQSDYDLAEQHLRKALDMYRRKSDALPLALAQTLSGLGSVLRNKNHFDEAERLIQEALAIQRSHLGNEHLDVATSMLELGRIYQDQGKMVPAESLYRDVLSQQRTLLGPDHPEVASTLESLAVLFRQQANLEAAEPLQRETLALRQRVLGAEHPHTVTSMYELASLLRDKEDFDQALSLFRQVVELDRKALGETHHYVGLDLREVGLTFLRMKAYDNALETYRAALDILREALPENHADIAVTMSGIGYTYLQKGEPDRAEPILRDVLQMRIATLGEDSWWTGVSKSVLGDCLMQQGRHAAAEPLLLEGYTTLRDGKGPTEAALQRLVTFYETLNQDEEAADYRALLDASSS